MGKKWDEVQAVIPNDEGTEDDPTVSVDQVHVSQLWHEGWLREVFRALKPGSIVKVFAATRTMHRLAAAMEAVGFVDLDLEAWTYGCLPEDTEILTKDGWVHYHKAKIGTEVLGFDLSTESFTWQAVEETFEYLYDNVAFRIYGDGTDHIVSIGHRCVIECDGHWDFRLSQEVPETLVVPIPNGMPGMPHDIYAQDPKVPGLLSEMRQFSVSPGMPEASVGTEMDGSGLHGMRENEVICQCVASEKRGDQGTCVFQGLQRGASGAGLGETRAQGVRGGVPGGSCICHCEDDGTEQPSLEGRGDVLSETWELRQVWADQVSSMPPGVSVNGPQGRVCDGTSVSGGSGNGETLDQERNRSSHESQSSGQSIGKSGVICIEPGSQDVRTPWETNAVVARVTASVESIPYHGVVWCVRVPTGAFVARRKGMAFITGNSGFPKSLNVSKQIDKYMGKTDEREVIGFQQGVGGQNMNDIVHERDVIRTTDEPGGKGVGAYGTGAKQIAITIPVTASATNEAKKFDGFGTALKPAWEPFVVGRKPYA